MHSLPLAVALGALIAVVVAAATYYALALLAWLVDSWSRRPTPHPTGPPPGQRERRRQDRRREDRRWSRKRT